jgi:hypothetical protein
MKGHILEIKQWFPHPNLIPHADGGCQITCVTPAQKQKVYDLCCTDEALVKKLMENVDAAAELVAIEKANNAEAEKGGVKITTVAERATNGAREQQSILIEGCLVALKKLEGFYKKQKKKDPQVERDLRLIKGFNSLLANVLTHLHGAWKDGASLQVSRLQQCLAALSAVVKNGEDATDLKTYLTSAEHREAIEHAFALSAVVIEDLQFGMHLPQFRFDREVIQALTLELHSSADSLIEEVRSLLTPRSGARKAALRESFRDSAGNGEGGEGKAGVKLDVPDATEAGNDGRDGPKNGVRVQKRQTGKFKGALLPAENEE